MPKWDIELIHFVHRFTEDIYQMTGYRPGLYWQLTWRYIGPAMMSVLLLASVTSMIMSSPQYGAWDAATVSSLVEFVTISYKTNSFRELR